MNTPNKHKPVKAKKHFAVSASPFNGIKLELALILVFGLILWLVLEQLISHRIEAFLMLVGYSLLAAGWIILRVRNVLNRHRGGESQDD